MVGMLGYGCTVAKSFSDNHLKAAFTKGTSDYLDEIEQLEETVGKDASVAGAQCITQSYREKALARNADYVASREGFEGLRALLDDATSQLGRPIDNIQQNLEGTEAHTKFSRAAVCSLTLQ